MLSIQVFCGDQQIPTATAIVRDEVTDKYTTHASTGTGPVDAAFKCIREQIPDTDKIKLLEYTVSSVTAGIDALAEVTVRLQDTDPISSSTRIIFGRSANTDVIVASAQAYLNALNRIISTRGASTPIHPQYNSI